MALFVANELSRSIEGRKLFRGVGFELQRGGTLAIRAPSGTGKTLLLRLLAGLDPLEEGRVNLDGKDQVDWDMTRWRSRVVYCAQRAPIFPGSPSDFADQVAEFAAQDKAQKNGKSEDPSVLAEQWGIADVWDKEWSRLSGGEAQRAALAIAVATEPDVLLLDEPTSALDREAKDLVEERLADTTSVWVTHDADQAERVADRILDLGDFALDENLEDS